MKENMVQMLIMGNKVESKREAESIRTTKKLFDYKTNRLIN